MALAVKLRPEHQCKTVEGRGKRADHLPRGGYELLEIVEMALIPAELGNTSGWLG